MNVRRSGSHDADAASHPFRSPYRCHDCDLRFWVVSRRVRVGGALVLAATIVLGVAVLTSRHAPAFADASVSRPVNAAPTIDGIIRDQKDLFLRAADVPSEGSPARNAAAP